jgi:5-methylcytosine-specific restriction endonuclease McrA
MAASKSNKNIIIRVDNYLILNRETNTLIFDATSNKSIIKFSEKDSEKLINKLGKKLIVDYNSIVSGFIGISCENNINFTTLGTDLSTEINNLFSPSIFICSRKKLYDELEKIYTKDNKSGVRFTGIMLKSKREFIPTPTIKHKTKAFEFNIVMFEDMYEKLGPSRYFDIDGMKKINATSVVNYEYTNDKTRIVSNSEEVFNIVSEHLKLPKDNIEESNVNVKRKTIPKTVRDKVWREEFKNNMDGNCYCCNNAIKIEEWHCGHILAACKGGPNVVDNLKPICSVCNTSMGDTNMNDFKAEYFPPIIKVKAPWYKRMSFKK